MTHIMPMDCKEALRMLALALDGEADAAEHGRMEQHLETCRSCWSRAEFERRLKREIAHLRHEPVRPEFEQHIRGLLQEWRSDGRDPLQSA